MCGDCSVNEKKLVGGMSVHEGMVLAIAVCEPLPFVMIGPRSPGKEWRQELTNSVRRRQCY